MMLWTLVPKKRAKLQKRKETVDYNYIQRTNQYAACIEHSTAYLWHICTNAIQQLCDVDVNVNCAVNTFRQPDEHQKLSKDAKNETGPAPI